MIRFDHDIDRLDALQKRRVTLFPPIGGAGNAERRNAMQPQGMTIALALDENHHSRPLGIDYTVDAIEAWLVARLPSEAIAALQRGAKSDGKLFTSYSAVRNAK